MNLHPFRGVLRADRGYVCLSCLLKQTATRYPQSHRYQSTTTDSAPSSTTDSGFAVEEGALRRRQGKPLKDASLSVVNSQKKPSTKQQTAKASSKKGKSGENNTAFRDRKAKAAKQKTKPKKGNSGEDNATIKDRKAQGAKQKTKPKGVRKKIHKPAAASDPTASAAAPLEHAVDSGEANRTEEPESANTPVLTALRRLQSTNRRKGNAGQGANRAKSIKGTSGVLQVRFRKIMSMKQGKGYGRPKIIVPKVREGPIQENDKEQPSLTPDQTPLIRTFPTTTPTSVTQSVRMQRVAKRGIRSIRRAAKVMGRANLERRKAVEQARMDLEKSLESSVGAQKEILKAKDKATKAIEAKTKGPRRILRSPTEILTKPYTFLQLDGHMSLKDALKMQPHRDLQLNTKDQIEQVEAEELILEPVEIAQAPVPGLSYGLERVLFNPGVYHVQDPRSRVFNFDPYLQKIMPVAEFDFNALKEYITSSRDESLKSIAQERGKRYVGSSSSMTGALGHFHFLLSQWRPINSSMLSQSFPDKTRSFTAIQRCPSAIFLRWKNGTYAIDADKEFDTANILSMLGKSMEKLLTLPTEDFERYRKTSVGQVSDEERNSPESFHYCTMGDFLMRSQLDAHDARLPGTGMFDLKTRAVVSIRMNTKNHEHGLGYQIKTRQGEWESFEREYFDMIRSAFLKYSLQVRMGRMDGVFVAFHNTERIFGFQYISLPEMDECLHGQGNTTLGDQEFKLSLNLLNKVLDRATKKFPEQSLRIHFETRELTTPFMYIIAEPVTEEQVQEIQSRKKSQIEEFERRILGLHNNTDDDAATAKSVEEDTSDWKDIHAKVEAEMTKDQLSSEINDTQSPEAATTDENSGSEGPLDASSSIDPGSLPAQDLTEGVSEQSAAPTVDDVDDEIDDEEDEDEDDTEEESKEEDQEEDQEEGHDESEAATSDEGKEVDASGTIEEQGPVHNEGEGESGQHTIEEITAGETSASEDPIKVANSDGEQGTADVVQEESASKSKGPAKKAKKAQTPADDKEEQHGPLLAMTLTVRSKVNDKYVTRPARLVPSDKWAVEYSLVDIPSASRAWSLYGACQMRRKKKLDGNDVTDEDVAKNFYLRRIREMSVQGRKWREKQDRVDNVTAQVVLDQPNPSAQTQRDGPSERWTA